MLKQETIKLEDLEDKSLDQILHLVLNDQRILTVVLPDGAEIIIQPKPQLKPLTTLEGYVPEGWKEEIYNES
jgi:hypothetical protein